MATSILKISVNNNIALVQLNRPPVNALDRSSVIQLTETFRSLSDDSSSLIVVISSEINGIFSAGADIKEMSKIDRSDCREFLELGQGLVGLGQDVLQHVLRILLVGGHVVEKPVELSMIAGYKLFERVDIPGL